MKYIALVLSSGVLLAAQASGAGELTDDLKDCRDLPSDKARLACYDRAIDRYKQAAAPQDLPASTPEIRAENSAEADFGKSAIEIQRNNAEKESGTAHVDELEARVARLQRTRSKYVVVTLDNGQVWRQVDSGNLRLSEGDVVVIRKASLGSFLMQKSGSKRSVRVKRSN